jgi:surfactin family lipopeptide synthetase C
VTTRALRQSLSEKLPSYMIPSTFVVLDSLPLTPTGKVDRNALPMPVIARPELDVPFTAPSTPLESIVASIWAETLGLDHVGIYDKFFDLGGHSLAAMRIVSQVMKTFRLELPPRALFDSPTVADMALIVTQNQVKNVGEEKFADLVRELEAMSEEEARNVLGKSQAEEIRK